MFINCKHCNALVATDPATDLPPERCPRCAGALRLVQAATAAGAPIADAPPPTPSADAPAQAGALPASSTAGVAGDDIHDSASAAPAAATPDTAGPAVASDPAPAKPAPATDSAMPAPATVPARSADTAEKAATSPAATAAGIADATAGDTRAAAAPATVLDGLAQVAGEPGTPAAETVAADATSSDTRTAAEPAAILDEPAEVAEEPVAPAAEAPAADANSDIPAAAAAAAADIASAEASTPDAPPPADPAGDKAAASARPRFLSKTAPSTASPAGVRRWQLPTAIAALALLLGLQVLLADRDRLAADPQWRPLVASACGLFGCSLPAWHEPAAFVLLTRDVRPHPDVRGALRVSATFRNDARWAQDWPRLVLTLSDVDGRPVAARAFGADEYLGSAAATPGLDPGQTADIALDIREPSVATVSYAFDFR